LRMFAVTARDLNRGGLKYNNCLWRVKTLYALASSKEEAVKLVEGGEAGLCGWCMCEAVAEGVGNRVKKEAEGKYPEEKLRRVEKRLGVYFNY